ncbi:MAG: magnesium transporter, partial [Oscillospiraceae bacterium]|nr:magnesium transporter [Oscillospiraceae bacterium]
LLNSEKEELYEVIESAYAIDIAIALEEFSEEELMAFYKQTDNEHMARILEQMDEDLQQTFVDLLDYPDILAMFKFMSNDDIADIIGEMPVNRRKTIMRMLKSKDSVDIASLLLYEDDTAGGIMTTEYIALSGKLTIERALNKIKEIGPKTEVIDTIFVLNGKKELIGVADLRDILVAENNELLESIMDDNVISVTPDMDQEEVSHIASKYDLTAVPVVNRKGALLGIITVDDIIDVLFEEQTEDILKMGGASAEESIDSTVGESVKFRLPWLLVNLVTAFMASFTLSLFEDTISQVVALSATMTIIANMGGNAGNQTMAIVLRSITLGEISLKDDWQRVLKPIVTGVINGAIIGSVAGAIVALRYGNIYLGVITVLAMIINNIVAGFFGFFVPLVLKAFNVDPALASSIFLTAATDVLGFFAFLSLAKIFMPLLV